MKQYDHKKIEKKWQKEWEKKKIYKTSDDPKKPKFYILDMFPYPSGEGLHVGHPKGYIATDIVARMKRMQGFNVLHPMGFDAFGLPAENYAIKMKTNPAIAVAKNVARYKKQLEILGFDYDWSREINTTDQKFYAWTQWIFLKLLEKGLAYESYEPIQWCPSCKTGLANEDVEDGKCERCSTPVEKKPLRQWVLKITDYADRLLADIDGLDWPESIKESQRNWIGRSEGAEIEFAVKDRQEKLKVFTTRPDTLFGVTYVVLAPEHAFVTEVLKHKETLANRADVLKYVSNARSMTEIERTDAKKDKTGVELRGIQAINPVNGEIIPVYVADYVLAEYGTGAVMAVPAHDERDFAFAKKYQLPIKHVIEPVFVKTDGTDAIKHDAPFVERHAAIAIVKHWSEDKYLCQAWHKNDWKGFIVGGIETGERALQAAEREIYEEAGYKNAIPEKEAGTLHSKFYHMVKGQNRFAHFAVTVLTLKNGECDAISESEAAIHDMVWIKANEVRNFINRDDMKYAWDLAMGKAHWTEEGVLVNSGSFSGKSSRDVKKAMTESVGGKWVVKYKLKDWVFSRQRYWGEPFPVVHSSEYKDVIKTVTPKLDISFYDQKIWKALLDGTKTVETRALNPEEPERLFSGVTTGDYVTGIYRKTDEKKIFKVKKVYRWNNLAELWADKEAHVKIFSKKYSSLRELTKAYAELAPEYADKANANGIVGWEVEIARTPLPVKESELPVALPKVKSYEPTGTGESPLAGIAKWVNVPVQKGVVHERETNTMPQWAGSSWYYLRYMDPKNHKALVDPKKEQYWNQVDFYVGGAEHATRHLIYARFWHKFLYDIGAVSTTEPFKKLQSVGLIMGEDGRKMSKRFGNVVNPDEIVGTYGADTMRIYEMFMGPFDQAIAWNTKGIIGSRRFIERVHTFALRIDKKASLSKEVEILLNQTIKKVTEDIGVLRHNTAVSSLMILANEFEKLQAIPRTAYEIFIKLLAPLAPHVTEEIWRSLGNKTSIHTSTWPLADETKLVDDSVTIVVQVGGKVRASFRTARNSTKEVLEALALDLPDVKKWIGNTKPTKIIVVPNKLVSIVL